VLRTEGSFVYRLIIGILRRNNQGHPDGDFTESPTHYLSVRWYSLSKCRRCNHPTPSIFGHCQGVIPSLTRSPTRLLCWIQVHHVEPRGG